MYREWSDGVVLKDAIPFRNELARAGRRQPRDLAARSVAYLSLKGVR